MKKTICSAAIFLVAFTTAIGQKNTTSQTIMTISWNNTSKAVSVTDAAYTFNKPESDSGAPAAYLSVTAENVDTFLLKAASRQHMKRLIITVKSYDSTGRLSHSILLKNAKISFLSDMFGKAGVAAEAQEASANIGIQSDDITVDGVAL